MEFKKFSELDSHDIDIAEHRQVRFGKGLLRYGNMGYLSGEGSFFSGS